MIVSRSRDVTPISWQCPPFTAPADQRMNWIEEQIQEGEAWLEGQVAYKDLPKNLKIFNAIFNDKTKSTLLSNSLKYNIRKFVETISEVREIGSYSSDAKQFKAYANMVNKVAKGVYLEAAFPRSIRKTLQFAAVMGRGYIWPHISTGEYGYGERKICFAPLGPLDVVPVQLPPATNDVQEAYVVHVYRYMPIAQTHGLFPLFQSSLNPISAISYESRVSARRADSTEILHYGDQPSRNFGDLYCEIRYTFIRDISLNTYDKEVPMGDQGTSWFYKVPFLKQEIFGGVKDGKPYTRPAVKEDCRLYPQLRLMISSKGMDTPMYDGPAYDWHGCIPTVQYDVDDWAWEGMGRSLVGSVGSIETTKRKIERQIDQVITTTLNPPIGYDRTSTGGPSIENFDIFEQDKRYGVDGEPTKVLQSLLPDSVSVKQEHFKFWEMLANMEKEELGINDLGNLANMKLNLSGDNLDKALEPIGPIAKGIAAGMEAANAKVAYMLKFMIPQWYDTKRIIEFIGPDNITPEVFDFDPASMVPSHMPDEVIEGRMPESPSQYAQQERAKRFCKNLRLISVPSTLLKITQQQEQLKWLTLKRQGAPISWATTLTKLGIENYGDVEGNTEREKWMNETVQELKFKAELAAAMQQLGLGGDEHGGPGQGKGGGRPNSNKKPGKVSQKGGAGGEPRTTLKTS